MAERNRAAFGDPSERIDNIFGQSFMDNREPAWHEKGMVIPEPLGSVEAYHRMSDGLRQFRAPLYVHGKAHQAQIPGYSGLFGYKTGEHMGGVTLNGGTLWTYGVVGDHYEHIFHADFCDRWQKTTGSVIETMGLLGDGSTLFLTVQLPTFGVLGDEIKPYLFGFNPSDGKTAITCKDVLTRVVCQNTCNIALGEASTFEFRAVHHKGVGTKLEKWLTGVWNQQNGCLGLLKEACESLAKSQITSYSPGETLKRVMDKVYTIPPMPEKTALKEAWEALAMKQGEHRLRVGHLFDASPTRTTATKGSLWGVYQAVVEYEDFARPRRQAQSRFMGEASWRKETAFKECLAIVKGE